MDTDTLIKEINSLPSTLSKDIDNYLDLLNEDSISENETAINLVDETEVNIYNPNDLLENRKPKLKRKFGDLKGFVIYISDDFDAPLDDFKDYMG